MTFNFDNNDWFFQSNPKIYKILRVLSDPRYKRMTWQVTKFKHDINKGDFVWIWVSGEKAGIYATAEIIEEPRMRRALPRETPPDKMWIDKSEYKEIMLRSLLEIKRNLQNNPILRTELKEKGLKSPPIDKFYQATNFKVLEEERYRIRQIILNR